MLPAFSLFFELQLLGMVIPKSVILRTFVFVLLVLWPPVLNRFIFRKAFHYCISPDEK